MSLEQKQIFKFYVGYDDIFNEIENLSNIKPQTNVAFDILKYDNNNVNDKFISSIISFGPRSGASST